MLRGYTSALLMVTLMGCTSGKEGEDTDLADTDATDTDSADTDATDTDSADTDAADTDAADTDATDTDTAVVDTDVADTDVEDYTETGAADTDVVDTDVVDTDVVDTDVADTDLPDTDIVDTDVAVFVVHAHVSGLTGQGMALRLGSDVIPVSADGTVDFVGVPDGATVSVVVAGAPLCPAQACDVVPSSPTVSGADVDVDVTCRAPQLRLTTSSWSLDAVRVTDDLGQYTNGAQATYRTLAGASTAIQNAQHDSVAIDAARDLLYVADGGAQAIHVYAHASTIQGDVAPVRTFTWDFHSHRGIEIDPVRDRLYLAGDNGVAVFDHASTLDGVAAPAAVDETVHAYGISRDPLRDIVYVSGAYSQRFVWIYDDAANLSGVVTASREVSWDTATGIFMPQTVFADACNDRVWIGSNMVSPLGNRVFAFDDASTVDGTYDLDVDSAAQSSHAALQLFGDGTGRVYLFEDSATRVRVFDDAATWSGSMGAPAGRTVVGVVASGYGAEIVAY